MRAARAGAALAVVLALVAGCGGNGTTDRPGPTRPSGASTPLSRAGEALRSLQASVSRLRAVQIHGGTGPGGAKGRRSGASDLRTGDFRVTVELEHGQSLRMLRKDDLTWVSAPASFWVSLGYTKASADRSVGRWVVVPVQGAAPLIAAMDPGVAVRSLLDLDPATARTVAPVRGARDGERVIVLGRGRDTQRIYVTGPSSSPRLVRITSVLEGVATTIDFVGFPSRISVALPAANEVLQAP